MEINLVVDVQQDSLVESSNPIAEHFRKHSVLEFKPHNTTPTNYDFYKTMGYACRLMGSRKLYERLSSARADTPASNSSPWR